MTKITIQGADKYRVTCQLKNGKIGTGRNPKEAYKNAKKELIIIDNIEKVQPWN